MRAVRKLIAKLFAPRREKILSGFGDVIVRTTKAIIKIDEFDESIKNLMINWLVSLPWAYFEELFVNNNSWNENLLALFKDVQVANGEDCALITQAFFLWHLEELTRKDDKYKKYSIKDIEIWIERRITKGNLLTYKLRKFRKDLQNLRPADWYLKYINEILNALYTDSKKTSTMIHVLQQDSMLRLSLNKYYNKVIRTAKLIDIKG